jgi:para-aminobenzoate synthetase component 1
MEKEWIHKMNQLGSERIPFLFLIDFEVKNPLIFPFSNIDPDLLLFNINGIKNYKDVPPTDKKIQFEKFPDNFETYQKAFNTVKKNLKYGNSYLLNLTFQTSIHTNLSLKEIFHCSHAKYRIWYDDRFVVFSPEIFVQTKNNRIYSFPMKGTIDAAIPEAEKIIMQNQKELAEHNTIVDLIRNDLSMVSKKVRVDRFRYIDQIKSIDKDLLQVSSQISGDLDPDFHQRLGDIFSKLLPAGSISGAPKKKTVEIIKQAETYNRGYYTGICGYFDGRNIDSGVMIRFIKRTPEGFHYCSGGGITVNSQPEYEYNEMIDKVYVPVV